MAALQWHRLEDLWYEAGLDHGVLYPGDGPGVSWNGLISVDESSDGAESKEFYYDGIKRNHTITPGEFSAKLSAITYPDEFLAFDGYGQMDSVSGIFLENQERKTFGLSYRTLIGAAEDGYKIHILYNLIAEPSSRKHGTLSDSISPSEFSWSVKSVPKILSGHRPMAHVILDSTKVYPDKMQYIEDILYGTDLYTPRLITPEELSVLQTITITDNDDGTWTIVGPDTYIYPNGVGSYELNVFGIHYIDANSYTISNS